MKPRQGLIIGAVIGCLLVAGSGRVEAKEIPLKGKIAGTFLHARIDRNDDGVPASWQTGVVTGKPGNRPYEGVFEFVPTGPTAECPGGVFIIDAQNGQGFGIWTETFPAGDQLYGRVLTLTLCSDGVGGSISSATLSYVGGTGKFAGASGNVENRVTSLFHVVDANANPFQGFGSFRGTFEGTLTLP